ncbi:MAG: hypothetical protein FWF59_03415 [Turicibacter sp.]|nr:hypothetical protein [Turicibacter sp.]
MKPQDIIDLIENMPNADRLDTLELLHNTYFYMRPTDKELEVLQAWYEGGVVIREDYEREFY